MSINHFSTAVPESFWRPQSLHYPPKCQVSGFDFNLNLNRQGDDDNYDEDLTSGNSNDRETLFEKPLTPSDVGKLNRLVIPKQHAERCFPLGGIGSTGADTGMMLSFEDESGKCWRFRYSYWSSSQSYVLTKGWSRYVKEKMLDAGDVVFFERHRSNGDRLFIGWRRRGASAAEPRSGYTVNAPYASIDLDHGANHAGSSVVSRNTTSTPSGNSKRFRLFGVNLEFYQQPDEDPSEGSQHYDYSDMYHGNLHNDMGGFKCDGERAKSQILWQGKWQLDQQNVSVSAQWEEVIHLRG